MRQPLTRRAARALLIAVTCALTSTASATVMVEVPLEELIERADRIVLGTVDRVETRLVVERGRLSPVTFTHVRVSDSLKGAPSQDLTLRELGGHTPALSSVVVGVPSYRVGDEVLVFVEQTRDGARTLEMCQGHFRVIRGVPGVEPVVERDNDAVAFAEWGPRGMTIREGRTSAMPLHDFVEWIGQVVAAQRALELAQ